MSDTEVFSVDELRAGENTKHQTPNTKKTPNPKHQTCREPRV
jgi:hypothetical protein